MLSDINPYVCLFEECKTPLQQYKTEDEWVAHMAWEHTKFWSCQVKGHEDQIFTGPDILADHIHQEHTKEIAADQILPLVERSAKPAPDTFAILALAFNKPIDSTHRTISFCPFCEDAKTEVEGPEEERVAMYQKDSSRRARDHIARHLETIALLSLPERDDLDPSNVRETSRQSNPNRPTKTRMMGFDPEYLLEHSTSWEDSGISAADSIDDDMPSPEQSWEIIFSTSRWRANILPSVEVDKVLQDLNVAQKNSGESFFFGKVFHAPIWACLTVLVSTL